MQLRVLFTARSVDVDNEYCQYQNGFLGEEHFDFGLMPFVESYAKRWRAHGVTENRPSFLRFVDRIHTED